MTGLWDDEKSVKRTLGVRDTEILYERSHHKCENPACGKLIEFSEMQVGDKKAYSKGGGSMTSFNRKWLNKWKVYTKDFDVRWDELTRRVMI